MHHVPHVVICLQSVCAFVHTIIILTQVFRLKIQYAHKTRWNAI